MRTRIVTLITVLTIAVASCAESGSIDQGEPSAPSTLPPLVNVTTTTVTSTSAAAEATSTTTTAEPTTTAVPTTSLAGGPVDLGPRSGDVLGVVGVAHDDTLNLRDAPGPSHDVVDTIDPGYEGLLAAGETWEIPGALWIKVDYAGTPGWVHLGFVAYMGGTDDVTAAVAAELGELPAAGSMEELGLLVAETFASLDPPSRIVMTVAATAGDLGEVTYDVVGVGDDSVLGLRLHVFGTSDGGRFTLDSVEMTEFCARGVDAEDFCV